MKKIVFLLVIIAVGGAAYYHYVYEPRLRRRELEKAYVLPDSLPVIDTTAVVRRVLATYHSGQAVEVEARIGEWAKLDLGDGQSGWVKQKELVDGATYQKGQALINTLARSQAQADGHTSAPANLRLGPSRGALKLGEFNEGEQVKVYGRRVTSRSRQSGASPADVWYLVRSSHRAGWILGELVDLDIPRGLSNYAQGINMVAWLPLDTVNDGGRQEPQYLAADRIGSGNFDFDHIRVFTWWVKRHKYVTAYVESHMDGFFPITVTHIRNVPYFRLRLVDGQGDKVQKVYGLFDTIVHPLGTVAGWTSSAMPPAPASRRRSRQHWRRSAG